MAVAVSEEDGQLSVEVTALPSVEVTASAAQLTRKLQEGGAH